MTTIAKRRAPGPAEYKRKRLDDARARLRSFNAVAANAVQPPLLPPQIAAPSRRKESETDAGASVTVSIAQHFAVVAGSVTDRPREAVADFLLRCAFTMFLSRLEVIPRKLLTCALLSDSLAIAWPAMAQALSIPATGIFSDLSAPPLADNARQALVDADACDWLRIDLSIFGSLVEGSLDKKRRHALGAHYTPREYIQRIVAPTIEEPLRRELDGLGQDGGALLEYHSKLCATRVLDPACGAGNFLIVALETLYGIEDDVLGKLDALRAVRPTGRVTPHQMHGIEIDTRACEVCKLVLGMCDLRRKHSLGILDGYRS